MKYLASKGLTTKSTVSIIGLIMVIMVIISQYYVLTHCLLVDSQVVIGFVHNTSCEVLSKQGVRTKLIKFFYLNISHHIDIGNLRSRLFSMIELL